jgi:hypothetical protein
MDKRKNRKSLPTEHPERRRKEEDRQRTSQATRNRNLTQRTPRYAEVAEGTTEFMHGSFASPLRASVSSALKLRIPLPHPRNQRNPRFPLPCSPCLPRRSFRAKAGVPWANSSSCILWHFVAAPLRVPQRPLRLKLRPPIPHPRNQRNPRFPLLHPCSPCDPWANSAPLPIRGSHSEGPRGLRALRDLRVKIQIPLPHPRFRPSSPPWSNPITRTRTTTRTIS